MRTLSRKMTMSGLAAVAALAMAPATATAAPAPPEAPTTPVPMGCDPHYITNPVHTMGPDGKAQIYAQGNATLPDPAQPVSIVVMQDQSGIDVSVANSPEGPSNGQMLQARGPWPGSGTYYTQIQSGTKILCSGPHVDL